MVFALFAGQTAWGQTSIVQFSLSSSGTATNGIIGNNGISVLTTNFGTATYSTEFGAQVSLWDVVGNLYWQTSFKTTGYFNISLSSIVNSDAQGPKDFIIEWSKNGTDYYTQNQLQFTAIHMNLHQMH